MDTKFAQALHALVYISETTGTASSQALAQSVGTNPSHIRKLTGLLKQGGIVESSQGKAGFVLARPAEDITLADVYDAVYPDKHLFNVHEDPNPDCPIGQRIGAILTPTFAQIEHDLATELGARTLRVLIQDLYRSAATTGTTTAQHHGQ